MPNANISKISVLKISIPKIGLLKKYVLLVLTVFSLSACATVSNDTQQEKMMSVSTSQLCTDPRPQVCTMIYDPVCGTDTAGNERTYASGCSACGRQDVVSYEKGACGKGAVQE